MRRVIGCFGGRVVRCWCLGVPPTPLRWRILFFRTPRSFPKTKKSIDLTSHSSMEIGDSPISIERWRPFLPLATTKYDDPLPSDNHPLLSLPWLFGVSDHIFSSSICIYKSSLSSHSLTLDPCQLMLNPYALTPESPLPPLLTRSSPSSRSWLEKQTTKKVTKSSRGREDRWKGWMNGWWTKKKTN